VRTFGCKTDTKSKLAGEGKKKKIQQMASGIAVSR
jgi:hypothetical protein